MSWYEEAANEVGVAILAKDGPIAGPREVAAIIAKHDPNRWIPVTESMPELGNGKDSERFVQAIGRTLGVPGEWRARVIKAEYFTHWREIVLPEVKG